MEKGLLFSYKDIVITCFLMDASSLVSENVRGFLDGFVLLKKENVQQQLLPKWTFLQSHSILTEMRLFKNVLVLLKFEANWNVNMTCF